MAKQTGITPLRGTIDNLTFYNSKHGALVRKKGGVDGKRIATDKAFKRTRETMAEFGRAGKAGQLIRHSIQSLLQASPDHRMVSRLVRELMEVIKTDPVNGRGFRTVLDGDIKLLKGFEFNETGPLKATLRAPFSGSIDRLKGELNVRVPAFVPETLIEAPPEATHFKIVSAGVEIDFEKEVSITSTSESADMVLNEAPVAEFTLSNLVTLNSKNILFLVVGVQFFQKILNGTVYPLKSGAFNPLGIIELSAK